jgi:hypothetical protein
VRPPTPAERLRSHVDHIVALTPVHGDEREELIEELYGHLWQSWQDRIASGLSSDEAADAAISDFGDTSRIGSEMTMAYHSRLYASTIGVLLPAVVFWSDKPEGYGRARAFLFLVGSIEVLTIVGVLFLNRLTPVRLVFAELMMLAAASVTILAYRALARAQRWALVYVKFLAIAYVAYCVGQLFMPPTTISFTGILVAIFILPAVFDAELARWVAGSRRTGAVIGSMIVASILMGLGANPLAAAMPDPTQASPSDLSMSVRVNCNRTDGLVTNGEVTATLRWARTDFLPYGLRPNMTQTDQIGVSSAPVYYLLPNAPPFERNLEDGVVGTMLTVVDQETGRSADVGVTMLSQPAFFDVGVFYKSIDPGTIQAGRTYVATFGFVSQEPTGLPYDPAFRIRYDHQGRWGVQAYATCDRPGTGQPVTTPEPPQLLIP